MLVGHQYRRNYIPSSHRKDGLIEWMKEMLVHSFVLNSTESYLGTMIYFEELIAEYLALQDKSRLKQFVPSISKIHTSLPLSLAFQYYDAKYSISKRRFISPSFNELRHILNLSQVMAIGKDLKLITFDGDQTLYSDGGNFEHDEDLAIGIMSLLCVQVRVAVVTAAGYGLDGNKYAKRLRGLLDRFIQEGLTKEQVECFYVFGGECNYLLKCTLIPTASTVAQYQELEAVLVPVPVEEWQAPHLQGPKPYYWSTDEVEQILDIAEQSMRETVQELNLRAKVLRKDRAVGVYPGGSSMAAIVPVGHGSKKLKREALDELVFRVMEALRCTSEPHPIRLPYCVFNGGTDAWLDIGNKSVGVAALQAYFNIIPANCLHVGDQFFGTGNDIAARETSPCIWIINPRETGKILQHILKYGQIPEVKTSFTKLSRRGTEDLSEIAAGAIPSAIKNKNKANFHGGLNNVSGNLCVYTGEEA